ncbi:hypothetical protein A2U01_0064946, partial [Trifolium medium]|nr:hypothetical protein [Trifolium medium]
MDCSLSSSNSGVGVGAGADLRVIALTFGLGIVWA